MPTYLMSLLRMPRVVKLRLEKIQKDFLWGGGALEKRPHLVNTKYGVERGGWSTRGAREGHGVGLWKEISKEAGSKDAWVADYWDPMGEKGGWTPHFLRPFNDWEVEEVERFLSSIQGKRLDADVEDRMLWKETKNEIFTVKSLYKSLVHSCSVSFPSNIIWSPYVPTKVSFFDWKAYWEKVLTQDQLKRRGWILANKCCLCCVEEETINHILVHCSKAKILWDLVFFFFGVNWVLPLTVRDTLLTHLAEELWAMRLGLKLLQERASIGSFWWAYISNLPETYSVPIFFPGEDIKNLQYAPLLYQVFKSINLNANTFC
ncbi:hypothetical protein CK203_114273 [Vitis vinifera]|uniref:Reverse transcriptase zinc-binding domain-containing protein n=1 Tax=Vitis vinifera TaxID=29760 RepID=A0A438CAX8_VITVI|nr:hypothetical protein CK203_114273 [Vitis vinifera]